MKSDASNRDAASAPLPRPFLYLKPARLPLPTQPVDAIGMRGLERALSPHVGHMVRCVVDYTIARQNRDDLLAQPIRMPVLNRRRRAARSWLLAIVDGRCDGATRHAVATQWLPLLCGTGPDLADSAAPGRELIEFVRGVATAMLFDQPVANLLPRARALHCLELTLAVHLAATLEQAATGSRALQTAGR